MRLFIEQSASTAEGRSKPRSMSIDPSDYPNADRSVKHRTVLPGALRIYESLFIRSLFALT